jgi:hypothetical protein
MKKILKSKKPVAAEAIAKMADGGKNVTHLFMGDGRMIQPIQRVNVDITAAMLDELDNAAQELNVSRQAVIKTLVRQALVSTTSRRAQGVLVSVPDEPSDSSHHRRNENSCGSIWSAPSNGHNAKPRSER